MSRENTGFFKGYKIAKYLLTSFLHVLLNVSFIKSYIQGWILLAFSYGLYIIHYYVSIYHYIYEYITVFINIYAYCIMNYYIYTICIYIYI